MKKRAPNEDSALGENPHDLKKAKESEREKESACTIGTCVTDAANGPSHTPQAKEAFGSPAAATGRAVDAVVADEALPDVSTSGAVCGGPLERWRCVVSLLHTLSTCSE